MSRTFYKHSGNEWVKVTYKDGVVKELVQGIKCPHCGRYFKASKTYEEWDVDAYEHITYCNPAHQRAVCGEER